jgi:D-xylose transport system substrate-binding protein
MIQMARKGAVASVSLALCLAAAACSSSSSSSTPSSTTSSSSSASASSSAVSVSISVAQFDKTFAAMAALKPLAAAGHGKVAVLLPDTTTSARYVQFDAPYLTQALTAAGLSSSQFTVQNAQGSDATQLSQAQTAITSGASVLIFDQLDPGVGVQVENYAKAHGVAVIDYDRLTLGGSREYYISFNNVHVGQLIGQGFVACATAWHVAKPNVLVMYGAPTDNNATLFAQGYNGVLNPLFSAGTYVKVGNTAGSWDAPTSLSEFEQQYTAHKNINSVLTPNDTNAAAIIHYLQTQGVKAKTFPATGQDATTIGLQNILAGYQCGSAYKPIFLEAQGAAALAMYLRAGKTPPTTLVNGTTQDTKANVAVPSVLVVPKWVTTANMETVITDGSAKVAQLCVGTYATFCKTYGIS